MDYLDDEKTYGIVCFLEDIEPDFVNGNIRNMTIEEIEQIIKKIRKIYDDNEIDAPEFKYDDFLINLINNVDIEDIIKYMINTSNYHKGKEYDENYVLCFRRAVPSDYPKPETFWSTSFPTVLMGLHREIPIGSAQRLHSVISVTTLARLKQHGLIATTGAVSDGEIAINPNESFSNFIFRYKPINEFYELQDYLNNGGISRDELLEKFIESSAERMKLQGISEDVPSENGGYHK